MSKPVRGTKLVCVSCGSKFYDLTRDPATCPICGTVNSKRTGTSRIVATGNVIEEDDEAIVPGAPEVISLDAAEAAEGDVPEIDEDLPDVDEDEENLKEDEEFLPEDDADADVADLIGETPDDDEVR